MVYHRIHHLIIDLGCKFGDPNGMLGCLYLVVNLEIYMVCWDVCLILCTIACCHLKGQMLHFTTIDNKYHPLQILDNIFHEVLLLKYCVWGVWDIILV